MVHPSYFRLGFLPIFEFAQSIVIDTSARLKPLQQFSLLRGIWIDAVRVVHCQHVDSLSHPHRLGNRQARGIHVSRRWLYERGAGLIAPRTPQKLKGRAARIPTAILSLRRAIAFAMIKSRATGEVAEWLNALDSKSSLG